MSAPSLRRIYADSRYSGEKGKVARVDLYDFDISKLCSCVKRSPSTFVLGLDIRALDKKILRSELSNLRIRVELSTPSRVVHPHS